jgi:hypothetical protein
MGLKLFSRDETELQQELIIVKTFSNDIRTEFGQDKSTIAVFKHDKLAKSQQFSRNNQALIRNVGLDETYNYHGHGRRWRYRQQPNERQTIEGIYIKNQRDATWQYVY